MNMNLLFNDGLQRHFKIFTSTAGFYVPDNLYFMYRMEESPAGKKRK